MKSVKKPLSFKAASMKPLSLKAASASLKAASFDPARHLPEDATTRLGSLGVIGGGLLALVALMF